jgi:Mg-chelatase subunit ChlI/Mg-chelatase subunit ChlD
MPRIVYPFSAIVGQDRVKRALLLCAVDPNLGGVLISGTKGSGKSTIIRALEEILPTQDCVKGCYYNCDPTNPINLCPRCREELNKKGKLQSEKRRIKIVELPLSSTEEGLLGTINPEEAIQKGRKILEPGILGKANQNILYIDEINLLSDYLIDCILDPAASGWNTVQREGLNIIHPAKFTLVASMNPEEGDLRPQILDRFALKVDMDQIKELEKRVEIIKRNLSFERDPEAFLEKYHEEHVNLRKKIESARNSLQGIKISENMLKGIADICSELGVEGQRSDIAILKAARANAAIEGRKKVVIDDTKQVFHLAVAHRIKDGLISRERIDRIIEDEIHTQIIEESDPLGKGIKPELKIGEVKLSSIDKSLAPRRKRRKPLNRFFSVMIILGMLCSLAFMTMITTPLIQTMLLGNPIDNLIQSLTPVNFLINLFLITAIFGVLSIFSPKSRPVRYLFTYLGQDSDRRLVSRLSHQDYERERETEIRETSKVLNIPLYASLRSLYNTLIEKGARIFDKDGVEEREKYPFKLSLRKNRGFKSVLGMQSKSIGRGRRGRYVSYEFPKERPWDIALAPTLRAAAPYQSSRKDHQLALKINPEDIRVKVREIKAPLTVIILLDMSESMVASLLNVRNAILSMRDIAFKRRDRIGLVVFKGQGAMTVQNPTRNIEHVLRKLTDLGASDLTPLASGLYEVSRVIRNETSRNRETQPVLIIISDGITNIPLESPLNPHTRSNYLNNAQADVIDVSHLLKKMKVTTLVINPSHEPPNDTIKKAAQKTANKTGKKWLEPTELMMEIPRITGGYYYGIGKGGSLEEVILSEAFSILGDRL